MRTSLPADLRAPAAARRFVTALLDELASASDAPRPDDIVLVVSELVTNSVRAGASEIDIELVASDGRLELRVSDDAPGWPRVRHPEWDDPQGRGLAIVEDVADDWHATSLNPGKLITVAWVRAGADGAR